MALEIFEVWASDEECETKIGGDVGQNEASDVAPGQFDSSKC